MAGHAKSVAADKASPSRCFLFCDAISAKSRPHIAAAILPIPPIPLSPPNHLPISSNHITILQGKDFLIGGRLSIRSTNCFGSIDESDRPKCSKTLFVSCSVLNLAASALVLAASSA